MNDPILNHEFSPPFLQAVNAALTACLSAENDTISTERFRNLSLLRHKVVIRALARLKGNDRAVFASKEIIINQKLEELARGLLENAKQEAVNFSRGRTAVKKYK